MHRFWWLHGSWASRPAPQACASVYEAHRRELSQLLELLLTGEVVSDRTAIEHLVRVIGVLQRLHERHRLDRHGHCAICWPIPRTW
jgi:hypothetical protein